MKTAVAQAGMLWSESNALALSRGSYWIGARLDESIAAPAKQRRGKFLNLFDPALPVMDVVTLTPGARYFLLDLEKIPPSNEPRVLASACKSLFKKNEAQTWIWTVEGVEKTPAVMVIRCPHMPKSIRLAGETLPTENYEMRDGLLYVRFSNESFPRELEVAW